MHGDKSQRQRERALDQFERGEVDTLVATDVAARGIDVRDISHVINFDPPEDGDTYTHRVGRTGRAGRTGEGITFVGSEQAGDVQKMAGQLGILSEFGQSGLLRNERGGARPTTMTLPPGAPRTTGARKRRPRSRTGSGSTSGRYSSR
jgi:ATP-dependent RNA helicase DeaD/ATP-dependent RNA helicase RhlE